VKGVDGRFFVDEFGRVMIFHGFNDVGEETKRVGPFDGYKYLPQNLISNETRLEILANEYGFNCFRIGAIWAALQPEPNVTDTRYLDALQNATRMMANHGVYSLMDMHQDALSTYQGWSDHDGAPTWVVNRTKPRHPYPWPSKGGDAAEAVAQAFQDIYKDTHGGRTAWAEAWKSFALALKDEKGVMGYELMNEPFAGDIYKDPLLLDPAHAGAENLQPAYDVVASAIREVDEKTVILYEPVTWGMIFDTKKYASFGSGFSHVPGGSKYANRSAYSYHYYCWLGRSSNGFHPAAPYPRLKKDACQGRFGMGPKTFSSVDETMKLIGGASFLTEFGGVYFTPPVNAAENSTSVEETVWILETADANLQSWSHWDLNYFMMPGQDFEGFFGCTPAYPRGCIKEFIRPYAQATAGTPIDMKYDRSSKIFTFAMKPDSRIQAPTEIFLPPYCYPNGYEIAIEPVTAPFTWQTCPNYANKLCLSTKPGASSLPSRLTISVSPKSGPGSRYN